MFVRYWDIPPLGGPRDYCIGVKNVDRLFVRKDPDDNYESWGVFAQDGERLAAELESREEAVQVIDSFCEAIKSGQRLFNLGAYIEEIACRRPDKPESEDKPC